MERMMFVLYTKTKSYSIIRIAITVIVGRLFFGIVYKMVNPVNFRLMVEMGYHSEIIVVPSFLTFAIIFEIYYRYIKNDYNKKLKGFKRNIQANKKITYLKKIEGKSREDNNPYKED